MSSDNPINRFLTELVATLLSVIEQKDDYLRGHAERVAELSVGFTKTLKLSDQAKVEKIYFAGLLHDIGMVYMSAETLNKSGPLNEDEMAVIRRHPILADNILSNMSILQDITPMIRHHHEAFDGSGYPDGLKGSTIPLGARMLAIVDSYDAMTAARPYREAIDPDNALEAINQAAGKRYDRDLVNRFTRYIQRGDGSRKRQAASEKKAAASIKEIILDIIDQFKEGKIALPVLPQVVQDVDTVLGNPKAKSDELVKVIERDAVISIRLISVANSPYYRGLEQITSVRTAISRIGHLETRKLVTAIANKSLYETKNIKFRRMMERLWLHGLSCGYAAVNIARHLGLNDAETYFFIGLVHEIGRVVLFKALSERLPVSEPLDVNALRTSVAPFYADLGSAMLKRWKYATNIIKAVGQHTNTEISKEMRRETLVLLLANSMANHLGFRVFEDDPNTPPGQSPAALALNIPGDALKDISESVARILRDAAQFF